MIKRRLPSDSDRQKIPVMVTGATGYVAGWVVRKLLDEGQIVHPYATSESFKLVKQFGDGSMKSGAPRMGFGAFAP